MKYLISGISSSDVLPVSGTLLKSCTLQWVSTFTAASVPDVIFSIEWLKNSKPQTEPKTIVQYTPS